MSKISKGSTVKANYYGTEIVGEVSDSRMRDGIIVYTLNLDRPVYAPWRSKPVYQILVNSDDVVSIQQ
jgi:hypothetical protein